MVGGEAQEIAPIPNLTVRLTDTIKHRRRWKIKDRIKKNGGLCQKAQLSSNTYKSTKKKKIKERVEVIKEIERQFPTGET